MKYLYKFLGKIMYNLLQKHKLNILLNIYDIIFALNLFKQMALSLIEEYKNKLTI